MPLTTSAFTSRAALKGEGAIHSEKWHRCWEKVQADGHDSSAAAAICTNSVGYGQSVNEEHQTSGRHASANPKRFSTKEGQRNARAREREAKKAKKMDATSVLKFNQFHDDSTGRFTTGSGGGGSKSLAKGSTKGPSKGRKPAQPRKGAVAPGHPTPDPDILHSPKDAMHSLLNGEAVNMAAEDVHDFLMEAANQHEDPDLTDVYVEGHLTFGGDGLGITRDKMPQVPRELRDTMLKEAKEAGISITFKQQSPLDLKPSQSEISARRVGDKLKKYESGKKTDFPSLLVSEDGYILDGHHHWGLGAALALDHKGVKVPTTQLNAPVKKALAFLNAFVDKHKVPRQSISQKQDPYMAEAHRLSEAFHSVLKYNPHHDKATGRFSSGGGGGGGRAEFEKNYKPGSLTAEYLSRMPMVEHARAKVQAQAKAVLTGRAGFEQTYKPGSLQAEFLSQMPMVEYDKAKAKPQFDISEVPLASTNFRDPDTAAGIKNYTKALQAQLAPKPVQAARHAASHVHSRADLEKTYKPGSLQAEYLSRMPLVEYGTAKPDYEKTYKPGSLTAEFLSRMPLVEYKKTKKR